MSKIFAALLLSLFAFTFVAGLGSSSAYARGGDDGAEIEDGAGHH